jgi:hypothetical protein
MMQNLFEHRAKQSGPFRGRHWLTFRAEKRNGAVYVAYAAFNFRKDDMRKSSKELGDKIASARILKAMRSKSLERMWCIVGAGNRPGDHAECNVDIIVRDLHLTFDHQLRRFIRRAGRFFKGTNLYLVADTKKAPASAE